ncbi:MAG: hypothetical protein JWO91_279 [Acidobacteriaceae bacterium]|nr:hypothetical protein [Acidobacteriaceae bacterium]
MRTTNILLVSAVVGLATIASAQQSADQQSGTSSNTMTVRGCLNSSRGNYIVAEDKTGMTYVLRGVGNKLDSKVNHEVQVTGTLEPGSQKTGIRSQKQGSNPADTVHGVDGTPLYVSDVSTDVKTVGKCKAADAR